MRQRNQGLPEISAGNATIEGIIRTFPERRGWLGGPVYNTNPQELLFLDPQAIAANIRQDVYVEARHQTHPAFLPIEQAQAISPQRHAEYRNTWLACAVVLALMFGYFVVRRTRALRSKTPKN